MGLGDDILCTGEARELAQKHGRPVRMRYDSPVWQNNPNIDPNSKIVCPCSRRYIRGSGAGKFLFNDWKCVPGDIFLSEEEEKMGWQFEEPYVVIEPNVKGAVSASNKDWGWEKWRELVRSMPHVRFLQFLYPTKFEGRTVPKKGEVRLLGDAEWVETKSIREAFGYIYNSQLFVGTDGALHHAAGALKKPAVVIWGGYSSPKNLGYDFHVNLADNGPESPCGSRRDCSHCRRCMDAITVDRVREAIEGALS